MFQFWTCCRTADFFLPRDAYAQRGVSVCLSVTRRYSVDTAEHIVNFLPRDACVQRGLSVCMSVRHTLVFCQHS